MKLKLFKDPLVLSLAILTICLTIFLVIKFLPQVDKQDSLNLVNSIDQIKKIEIISQSQISQLEKTDQGWIVTSEQGLPADQNQIDQLLKALAQVAKTDLVSKNANDSQQKYGFGPETVIRLKISYQNASQTELLIGNSGPDFQKDYVLIPNQTEIYLSSLGLRSVLIQPRWRNLTVTSLYSDQIKEITINQKTIVNLEDDQVKKFISQITNLMADQVQKASPDQNFGFEKSKLNISIKAENQTINLIFGSSNQQKQQYLKTNQPETIYLINSEKFKEINQAADQLLALDN